MMTHYMASPCLAAMDRLPVELLELIFTHLRLADRKNIRLTCKMFYDICNAPKFLAKEELVLRGNLDAHLTFLAKSRRRNLNVRFVSDAVNIPICFWEKVGDRLHSLIIVGTRLAEDPEDYCGDFEYYPYEGGSGTYIDNSTTRSILFHCTNSNYILIKKTITRSGGWTGCDPYIFTYVYKLEPVSNVSTINGLTIRALEKCSCSPVNAKEIYASTYSKDGRIEVETIYLDIEPQRSRYRYLLNRIVRINQSIFQRNNRMKYLGVRISVDCARLNFLRRIARSHPNLRALAVRFDSTRSEKEISNQSGEDHVLYESRKQKCSSLKRLQHLTVYGGCSGMLRIFENLHMPSSLKHLDIYASDVQSMAEMDDGSSILSVLEYVAKNLPNLEILRVDNRSEWVARRTTLTDSTSSFLIDSKDEDRCRKDVCEKHVCCKLSSVRHRFRGQNYTLTESESCIFTGWTDGFCSASTTDGEDKYDPDVPHHVRCQQNCGVS